MLEELEKFGEFRGTFTDDGFGYGEGMDRGLGNRFEKESLVDFSDGSCSVMTSDEEGPEEA